MWWIRLHSCPFPRTSQDMGQAQVPRYLTVSSPCIFRLCFHGSNRSTKEELESAGRKAALTLASIAAQELTLFFLGGLRKENASSRGQKHNKENQCLGQGEKGSARSEVAGARQHFVVSANEVRQWPGGCFHGTGAALSACLCC